MSKTILIKLGGSLITDKSKPYTVRKNVLERLAKEIHEARKQTATRVVIGHGGGSFPHVSASKYKTKEGFINKNSKRGFAEVQNDASRLNRIVVQALLDAGENAVSINPSSTCIAKGRIIQSMNLNIINTLLDEDFVPVPFGDVVLDSKQGCCIISTEEIFRYITLNMDIEKIIMVGKVDGVFDGDPNNRKSNLIPEITKNNIQDVKKHLMGSDATDVTGGMLHKVEKMMELAKGGVKTQIINGLVPGNLKRAMLGEKIGTAIMY